MSTIIGARGTVTLTPFFDLVLVWNQGISYGLLPQEGALGRLGLIALRSGREPRARHLAREPHLAGLRQSPSG